MWLLTLKKPSTGEELCLPRFKFVSDKDAYPFTLQRRQFPVRPAFAMSINKAQGQTLRLVGVWLPSSVFSHGQLYVATSRVGLPTRIRFAIVPNTASQKYARRHPGHYTRNVVYTEIFARNASSNTR